MKFDIELYKTIIGGNCIAFIGAGISAALGYPDWKTLCERALTLSQSQITTVDAQEIKDLIAREKFSEALEFMQSKISRGTMLKHLETLLVASKPDNGSTYKYLAAWPFSCYLTTNFDNEIERHLTTQGKSFLVYGNTANDLP